MRSLRTLLLAASMTLTGCALQPHHAGTPSSECSLGDAGWQVASHVDPAAVEAAHWYGPPASGDRTLWLENAQGDYRYCVLQPGTHDKCGSSMRVLHLWKQDGRWNSTGWFDRAECRRGRQ